MTVYFVSLLLGVVLGKNSQEEKVIVFLLFFKGKLKHLFHNIKVFAVLLFWKVDSPMSCDSAAFMFLFVYIIS